MGTSSFPLQLHPGWCQGALVRLDAVIERGGLAGLEPGTLAIVISQDCDVVHPSLQAEPFVEIHLAKPISASARNGLYFHGHNPRRMQFESRATGEPALYEINVNEKTKIGREVLIPELPVGRLEPDLVGIISSWTAKRYTRSAFPNAFNERCRPARRTVERALKRNAELLTALFLRLDTTEELGPDEMYRGVMRATATRATLESFEQEQRALQTVSDLEAALNSCDGVEIEARLEGEDEFTLADLRLSKRWDFEFLSYATGNTENMAANE